MKILKAIGKGVYWAIWGLVWLLMKLVTVAIPSTIKWTAIGIWKFFVVVIPFLVVKGIPFLIVKGIPWLIVKGIPKLFIGLYLSLKWTIIGLYKIVTVGIPYLLTVVVPYIIGELIPLLIIYLFKGIAFFIKSLPIILKEVYQLCVNVLMLKIIIGFFPIILAISMLGKGYDAYVLVGMFMYIGFYAMGITKVKETFYFVVPGMLVSLALLFN